MLEIGGVASALFVAVQVLLPPPDLSGAQWAETYRVLSREDSSAPGRWSNDARPYQVEILDSMKDPLKTWVTIIGPAQFGKTQMGLNFVGSSIHLDPGPMMAVFPTISMGEKWSKTRFSTMVRDCPELAALVAEQKSRDSSNTILEKMFPGGSLIIVGANAPGGLAAQPVRYLYLEEVDRVPINESAGEEGDFESLAEARTKDFKGLRKIVRVSSPTILGASRIHGSFKLGDMRLFHFRCPHCGHEQRPIWENVVWPEGQPELATYACAGAGCPLSQGELSRALRVGRWVATQPQVTDHASFWVHGLQVQTMTDLAKDLIKAKRKGIRALQTWKNTSLGELWDPRDGETIKAEGLMARREVLEELPEGVALITAGVDVQDDRLEVTLKAWGVGEEGWAFKHELIHGNLALDDPWERLEELLLVPVKHVSGALLRVRAAGVDIGGHFGKKVYAFCRRPAMRGIAHPVKGSASRLPKAVQRSGKKARLWLVDTDAVKDIVYARLRVEKPGPGYQHFGQDLGQDYFEQLLAEHVVPRKGGRTYDKIMPGARNEALDCDVYATAALYIFNPRDLGALAAKMAESASKSTDLAPKESEPAPKTGDIQTPHAPQKPRMVRPQRRAGGFVNAWRR